MLTTTFFTSFNHFKWSKATSKSDPGSGSGFIIFVDLDPDQILREMCVRNLSSKSKMSLWHCAHAVYNVHVQCMEKMFLQKNKGRKSRDTVTLTFVPTCAKKGWKNKM